MRPNFILLILFISTCIVTACSGPITSMTSAPGDAQHLTPTSSPATPTEQPPAETGGGDATQVPTQGLPEETIPDGSIPEGAIIVYHRSGGFGGLDEEWTINSDGSVTTNAGRQWQTSPERVADLIGQLESLGFFELQAKPISLVPCCDRFYYELIAVSGERTNTVATYDGATATPPSVWQAMEVVVKFLEQASQ